MVPHPTAPSALITMTHPSRTPRDPHPSTVGSLRLGICPPGWGSSRTSQGFFSRSAGDPFGPPGRCGSRGEDDLVGDVVEDHGPTGPLIGSRWDGDGADIDLGAIDGPSGKASGDVETHTGLRHADPPTLPTRRLPARRPDHGLIARCPARRLGSRFWTVLLAVAASEPNRGVSARAGRARTSHGRVFYQSAAA